MITPPIFAVCRADSAVTTLLGASPMRLYQFGLAPQGVQKPYAVWQMVAGGPETYLAGRPDAESATIQIDVYADTPSVSRQVLAAIEYAIELHCNVTRYGGESRDPETMNYRSSMDVIWLGNR